MSQYEVVYRYAIDNTSYNKALNTMTNKLNKFLNLLVRYEKAIAGMEKPVKANEAANARMTQSMKGMNSAIEMVNGSAARHSAIQTKLTATFGAQNAKLMVHRQKLQETAGALQRFSTRVGSLRNMMLGFYAVQATRAILRSGVEFSKHMVRIRANTMGTIQQMEELRNAAFRLNLGSIFDPSQIAEGMFILTKAGESVEDILKIMPAVVNLSTIAEVTPAEGASMLRSVLGMYGKGIHEAARVTDILAFAQTRTQLSVDTLFESLKNVGGIAHGLGIPLEQTVGHLAGIREAGVDASKAGTLLMNMYMRMAAMSEKGKKTLAKLGYRPSDFMKDGVVQADEFLRTLQEAGVSTAQLKDMFEIRGMRGAIPLMSWLDDASLAKVGITENTDKVRSKMAELMKGMEDIDGFAERMSKKFLEGLFGSTKQLESAWYNLKIQLADTMGVAVIPLMDKLRVFIEWLTNTDEKTNAVAKVVRGLISVFLLLVAALFLILIPLSLVAGSLAAAKFAKLELIMAGEQLTQGLIGLATKMKVFIAATNASTAATLGFNAAWYANPIVWIIAGIVALIAVFAVLYTKIGNVTDTFKAMGRMLLRAVLLPIELILLNIRLLIEGLNILGQMFGVTKAGGWLDEFSKFIKGHQDILSGWTDHTQYYKDSDVPVSPNAAPVIEMTDDRPVIVNVNNTLMEGSLQRIQTEINQGIGWTR